MLHTDQHYVVFTCVLTTLTVFAEAAQLSVLLPEDVLQPLSFVEVGETVQATEQDFRQRAKRESMSSDWLNVLASVMCDQFCADDTDCFR